MRHSGESFAFFLLISNVAWGLVGELKCTWFDPGGGGGLRVHRDDGFDGFYVANWLRGRRGLGLLKRFRRKGEGSEVKPWRGKEMTGGVKSLNSKSELDAAVKSGVSVLHFWASWCEPSKAMEPVLAQLAVDCPQAHFFRVPSLPSTFFLRQLCALFRANLLF